MITQIGIAAGEIWQALEKEGEVPLSHLVTRIKQPKDLVLMSIGWLAREGHVIVRAEGPDYRLSLRKDSA